MDRNLSIDPNLASWMISGGPRMELASERRDREQLHAYRESQRLERADRPSWFQRLRGVAPAHQAEADLVCCPA